MPMNATTFRLLEPLSLLRDDVILAVTLAERNQRNLLLPGANAAAAAPTNVC